jgi:DNA modification methylase
MTAIKIADKFDLWPVRDLVPYEKNSRLHPEDQVAGIAASIAEFGFIAPIIVDTNRNRIAAGHGRLMAARLLGMDRVPVVAVEHMTERQFRAYVIADNKHTDNSRFDEAVFAAELADLRAEDFDLEPLGFSDEELAALLPDEDDEPAAAPSESDSDAVPEPPPAPTSERGDVWRMGKHRLLCGDSLDLAAVAAMMAGDLADLVVTDPPYNVAYQGKTADALTIENDAMADGDFYQFLRDAYTSMFAVSRAGAPIYVFHADSEGVNFRRALVDAGWLLKQCCIWVKDAFVLGRQDYHWQHEPCLYGWKPGAAHTWSSDRKQTTVWQFARPKRNAEHPTMKPVALIRYPIENSAERGAIVLDLFGGSGSTLIACEESGRRARLVELDPRYADVIVQRWQARTGRVARLGATGETFAEVAARRAGAGMTAAPAATTAPPAALVPAPVPVPFFNAGQPFVAANDDEFSARKRA